MVEDSSSSSSSANSGGTDDEDDVPGSSEWEVISLSLSSHSLAASTFETGTGEQIIRGKEEEEEEDVVDVGLQSDYIFCSSSSVISFPELRHLAAKTASDDNDGDDESLIPQCDVDSEEKRIPVVAPSSSPEELPKGSTQEEEPLAATDHDHLRQEEEHAKEESFSDVDGSCTSRMQDLLQMNWSKPVPSVVDYDKHNEIRNKSLSYVLAPELKAGSQPDFGQTGGGGGGGGGVLLDSCLSTPSSPVIVSWSSSLQLLLGEELCRNQICEGNESGTAACLVEEQQQQQQVRSLAGLERTNSEFEFPDSDEADMQQMKNVESETRKSSAALPGDRCYEHTWETWWKRRPGVLWCMQARQATTLWSIALAAVVMGLVILGHQWQHERCQNQQLQLQLCAKDEKISHLTYQVARLKEAMLGRRQVPVLRSSSAYHSF